VASQATRSPGLRLYTLPEPVDMTVPSASRPRISGLGDGYRPLRK